MMKALFGIFPAFWPVLVYSQEGAKGSPEGEASNGSALEQFSSNYSSWDAVKVAWLFATIAIAYAVATAAFLMLLPNRNPTLAAKYGLAWGGLAFVLIHFFVFGLLLALDLSLWVVVLLAVGIFTLIWIGLALGGRKK